MEGRFAELEAKLVALRHQNVELEGMLTKMVRDVSFFLLIINTSLMPSIVR